MALRKIIFVNGEIYHLLNRSLYRQPIFSKKREAVRALDLINYYSFLNRPTRFSKYLLLSNHQRQQIMEELIEKNKRRVRLISFCLMPNHFHLLIKQKSENGISRFMSDFQNSFVRYYNTKNEKKGPLFESQFKAVRILSEGQLLHVSRYIHLNPYSGYLVKNINDLESYQWSSFREYLGLPSKNICYKDLILSAFSCPDDYKKFVFDRADYQRELEQIKHLILE